MFTNNIKLAWRNLSNNMVYALITLLGLSIGIAAVLLIYRLITFENSFNKSFANYDRIVRVVSKGERSDGSQERTICIPIPAMAEMSTNVPQFEHVAPIREIWPTITVPNPAGGAPLKKFATSDHETALFVEPAFLKILDFQWLSGNPDEALNNPNGIVLTRTMAEKCFDNWANAMGKDLMVDHLIPIQVTGVIEDLPKTVDFNFPFLIAYEVLRSNGDYYHHSDDHWGSCMSNDQVYALLKPETTREAANESLALIGQEHYSEGSDGSWKEHYAQPMSTLHFSEDFNNSGTHRASRTRLNILGAIGMLILILACFNFINLTTAQATLRAKEVGVRKTLGGQRSQLIFQFLTETGLVVVISVALGFVLAYLSMPLLSLVSDIPESTSLIASYEVFGFAGALALVITFLAGLYPALVLSGFAPVKALKNNFSRDAFSGAQLRKTLVVFQFVIAQALVVGAIITLLQLDFVRSKDLGFEEELVYTFGIGTDSLTNSLQSALKQKMLQIPTVNHVSFNTDQPLSGNTWNSSFKFDNNPDNEPFSTTMKFGDSDYQKVYDVKLLAGRWIHPSDTMKEAVINKTLMAKLGYREPNEILRKKIRLWGRDLPIVGVTSDFHTHSLHEAHQPLTITSRKELYWEVGVKIASKDPKATTLAIQKVFDDVLPAQVFRGAFLDERIAQFYINDNRLANVCKGFGFLAILISCLGLFGLAAHASARRVKEIGIRKVLGASAGQIIGLLTRDFLKLVFIALIIASPLAWYLMDQWLNNFVYRIDIPWWIFALTGVVAIAVAFLTVGFQSLKAAMANPIESIRSE